MTISDFADNVLAYAAIRRLPPSYGMLASTFHVDGNNAGDETSKKPSVTLDKVIARVAAEYRRRQSKGETVNQHGLLANHKTTRGGS